MFDEALFDQIVFDGIIFIESIPANPKAYNGYLCFMEQYIKNLVAELAPLKLPDGTLWE